MRWPGFALAANGSTVRTEMLAGATTFLTMVEAQRPEYLPLDPLLEVHIPADRSSIAYRRGLRSQGYSDFFLR